MLKPLPHPAAAYDHVGAYEQNRINGFNNELLDRFIFHVEPQYAETVLDAMAGDGNLTGHLFEYCTIRSIPYPRCVVLEYSTVQSALAKERLISLPAEIITGDVLTMKGFDRKKPLEAESFDRVMIKSANHEIPREKQHELYEAVYDVLKPGGKFVNLGFTFTDEQERDEFREIARTKDRLAQMHDAEKNRHFLMRSEFYHLLRRSGFSCITGVHKFDYTIESASVAQHYFDSVEEDIEHQVAQCRARTLRRNGRIRFLRDRSIMRCPGEITVAEKPSAAFLNLRTFRAYPYDFVRKIHAHEEMLDRAVSHIPARSEVLDLACGIGLLAERLIDRVQSYQGLDVSSDYIGTARERFAKLPGFRFDVADLHRAPLEQGAYDAVAILNALYLPGLNAPLILEKARDALRPGGKLIISGPLAPDSFSQAEPHIRKQLEADGHLPSYEATFAAIVEANRRLLTQHGNYWSAEGLVTLLRALGFGRVVTLSNELYYHSSYLAVVEKSA